jgi:uncharacterized membrane protein
MTASKSSRARNARAGAQTAAARNGSQARGGQQARGGTGTAVKSGARNGNTTRGGTSTAVRNGSAQRGARARVPDEAAVTEAGPSPWLQITTFVLSLAGLGVSIYLTIAHFTESTLAGCSDTGLVNCTKVTTSAQSYVFGIPVAVLGLAFFAFAVAIMSPWAWQASRREIHILRMASVVVGIGFVLYLVYAELFIIGSICLYCTSVHAITFLIFLLTAFAAAMWGFRPGKAFGPRLTRAAVTEA